MINGFFVWWRASGARCWWIRKVEHEFKLRCLMDASFGEGGKKRWEKAVTLIHWNFNLGRLKSSAINISWLLCEWKKKLDGIEWKGKKVNHRFGHLETTNVRINLNLLNLKVFFKQRLLSFNVIGQACSTNHSVKIVNLQKLAL